MYIHITRSETGDNKGSCGLLVHYLEKENRANLTRDERWFNGNSQQIYPHEVRMQIDRNVAKLTREDSKFLLLNISPSQQEIQHLIDRYGEDKLEENLKAYSTQVLDAYAKNFKRNSVNSHQDLLWFAKVEQFRYYGHQDKEVKNGQKQRGDKKDGQQWHIQVIVSRKDKSNKIKLSPYNTSKGKNQEHSKKLGQFNRVAFKAAGESLFDELFAFNRGLKHKMTYANLLKNGTAIQKAQLQYLEKLEEKYPEVIGHSELDTLVGSIQEERFSDTLALLAELTTLGLSFFSLLLEDHHEDHMEETVANQQERKRKLKARNKRLGR